MADTLGIAANTASTLVSQLAQLGLVERATDTADARVVRLYPTRARRGQSDRSAGS